MYQLPKWAARLGIFGALQFFVLSAIAMWHYPGGTIHDRASAGYSFLYNYFSDLGRLQSWNGQSNALSNFYFVNSLTLAGAGLTVFFIALPFVFRSEESKRFALAAALTGIAAALCYIGIAHAPLDVNYWRHTLYVRAGFISFLVMSISFALAIFSEPDYPRHYAYAFIVFGLVLFVQITIMLFGPRAWSSPQALFLQATAQKIVVYSELVCMAYQCRGVAQMAGKLI